MERLTEARVPTQARLLNGDTSRSPSQTEVSQRYVILLAFILSLRFIRRFFFFSLNAGDRQQKTVEKREGCERRLVTPHVLLLPATSMTG